MIEMVERKHRVSIGLPAYNGEWYLREALDALRVQTFTDSEMGLMTTGKGCWAKHLLPPQRVSV